jgi:hypothetical protein
MGIKLYNKIPNKIGEVVKMRQFKRVFRSYLVQHVFYSVEEYEFYIYICMTFPMSVVCQER